jgi:hypothetical protein
MKSYQVTLTEEIWHTVFIEAESKREAEEKAWELLNDFGKNAFKQSGSEFADNAWVEEA